MAFMKNIIIAKLLEFICIILNYLSKNPELYSSLSTKSFLPFSNNIFLYSYILSLTTDKKIKYLHCFKIYL